MFTGAAADINVGCCREVRMQRQTQETSLGIGVHGEIEDRISLNHAADHPLDLTRSLFEY